MAGPPLLVLALAVVTACAPEVSDTGFRGTWQRGGERVVSTLSICEQDGQYLVRWGVDSDDGKYVVRCDWSGACEERVDGEVAATYQLRSWIDPETSRLKLQRREERIHGPVHSNETVDELSVHDDGRTLVLRTVLSGQREFHNRERPKYVFKKVSDDVIDPPRGGKERG